MKNRAEHYLNHDRKYLWHPFTQMQSWIEDPGPVIEKGEGAELIDTDGRRYIDGVSSLWTNVHGHCRMEINDAIREQLEKVAHTTMLGLTHPGATELARRLAEITPPGLSRVFFSDDGSTAAEVALKMAYQYWRKKGFFKRTKFLVFEGAYHGDTIGSVSLGAIEEFHRIFRPLLFNTVVAPAPYCYRCPIGSYEFPSCSIRCLERVEALLNTHRGEIAAVVIEPMVQGAAGIITQPPAYMQRIQELCRDYDTLLLVDEVATGFGRTGRMFACEHEDIRPDLMSIAKGLSGGYLPIAATITSEEIFQTFLGEENEKFFHGHTYTGNPLACAAALANLDIFVNDAVVENLEPRIERFSEGLKKIKMKYDAVGDIRQRGMMAGIELVENASTKKPFASDLLMGKRVARIALNHGVIIRPLGDVIVLMPPLCISEEQLDTLCTAVQKSIGQALDEIRKKTSG